MSSQVAASNPGVRPAEPRHLASGIVVREDPRRGGTDARMGIKRLVDDSTERHRVPGRAHVWEIERRVQLVRAKVVHQSRLVVDADFADQDPVAIVSIGDPPPGPVDLVDLGPVPVRMFSRRHRLAGGVLRGEVRQAARLMRVSASMGVLGRGPRPHRRCLMRPRASLKRCLARVGPADPAAYNRRVQTSPSTPRLLRR